MKYRLKNKVLFAITFSILISLVNANALRGADFAVYVGAGTWQPSIIAFEKFLSWKNFTYEEVNKYDINNNDLRPLYKAIFFPGGWAADYKRDINAAGRQNIRNLVGNGGAYIGMSAGAYYACDDVVWEGKPYAYPLDLFIGDCIGPIDEIAPWPNYVMTTMNIDQTHPANVYEPAQRDILYYGEPYFVANAGQEMLVFASWKVPSNPSAHNKPGIIGFNYGQGRVLLVGPHPEIEEDSNRDGTTFADELSDGPDYSDWPFLWTAVDWLLKKPVTIAPDDDPSKDRNSPLIVFIRDMPDPLSEGTPLLIEANVTDDVAVNKAWVTIDGIDHFMIQESSVSKDLLVESFESGSFATNGWVVYGSGNPWLVSTLNPLSGVYHAQSQQSGAGNPTYLEKSISTIGFRGISVSYNRKLVGLDAADDFSAEWFDGNTWNVLEHVSSQDNANYISKIYFPPSSANENPNFKIRFMCETGAVSEYCRIDNVKVSASTSLGMWQYTYNTTGLFPQIYTYTVNANDTSGNLATPVNGTFTLN